MKTLYESLLDDIDTTMKNGSEWAKEIEKEKKEFLKVLGAAKNYEGGYSLKNGRSNGIFTPNVLHELGYDANHIHLLMFTRDSSIDDSWVLELSLSRRSEDNMRFINTVLDKRIYMDRWVADNWRGFIKNVIKPATKSLDTFKRFISNMEKLNGQYISPSSLLK